MVLFSKLLYGVFDFGGGGFFFFFIADKDGDSYQLHYLPEAQGLGKIQHCHFYVKIYYMARRIAQLGFLVSSVADLTRKRLLGF